MSYRDVYFSRVNHLGNSTAERIRNAGIHSFERWIAQSPFTVRDLSVERGIYFNAIIETHKDKEYQKILVLRVANDIDIQVGDIMNWLQEDGTLEKWLFLQQVQKINGTYKTFYIIKCNYLLKWIDAEGHIQESWAYVLSSTDDKVKGNFRTWHNLISPQPNKYAEIIMPYRIVDRGTNFIVEDEGWKMVEADFTSVKGIIYMSLTESKVNYIYDDLEIDLADTDKLAIYRIDFPETKQVFSIGSVVSPIFTLMKNGIPSAEEVMLSSSDPSIIKEKEGALTAIKAGTADIIVQLKNYPAVRRTLPVTVTEAPQVFDAYIEGSDTVRLDRYCSYKLVGLGDTVIDQSEVQFSLEMSYSQKEINEGGLLDVKKYASIYYDPEQNQWVVHANDKNKLHDLLMKAVYQGQEYTKLISIIPLW